MNENLKQLLAVRSVINKDVVDKTMEAFTEIKRQLALFEKKIRSEIQDLDSRIKIIYTDRGIYESELKVADDTLIFIMHTNSFTFEESHPIYKTSYISLNQTNAVCGMISIYNFMTDSFTFDRRNDTGQLIARIFVNREGHFFVEGMRQIGILFNDFNRMVINPENIEQIIESCVTFSLDIEVKVPPFDSMKQISVLDAIAVNLQSAINAGSRLGFKYQGDNNFKS
jgi:hypothetical protein